EGDREAAAGHWRMLAQRLPSDDRRFLGPARALARFAIDAGELEQARTWLERARTIEPEDRESLEQLLEVARGLEQADLILSTSALLLGLPSPFSGSTPPASNTPPKIASQFSGTPPSYDPSGRHSGSFSGSTPPAS